MTQAELAKLCNNHQPHVVRWEKGEISYITLKKVARALDCTMDELVEDENEPKRKTPFKRNEAIRRSRHAKKG